MRILNTETFELRTAPQDFFKNEGYAILSHRWIGAEITYDQIQDCSLELRRAGDRRLMSPQLDKIRGACMTARQLGYGWMWIDNCCINKSSSSEESESINSMFRWYRDARICITYLSDVEMEAPPLPPRPGLHAGYGQNGSRAVSPHRTNSNQRIFQSLDGQTPSEWFSRGWTLQELLAPREMRFYDMNWNFMGTKTQLAHEIQAITGIDVQYLTGGRDFRQACIATKMSWMAGRKTTREEDVAYGMLGLFNTTMNTQYGEGMKAFMRLQTQLVSTVTDESLFAWRMPHPSAADAFGRVSGQGVTWHSDDWGMLAPTPDWFKDCGNVMIEGGPPIVRPSDAFQLTREGMIIPVTRLDNGMKHDAIYVASQLTLVGALPTYYYLIHRQKNQIMEGTMMPLNCWVRDDRGKLAAVTVCLQPTSRENLKFKRNVQNNRMKLRRIRTSEVLVSYEYKQNKKIIGEAVILQPQLMYDT
ncbi:HET-domain-containing protein [Xylariomycetidae sp. FL2044]|nr:HET-domain-containing protein [Xylariomycetidae sp. FL2044]